MASHEFAFIPITSPQPRSCYTDRLANHVLDRLMGRQKLRVPARIWLGLSQTSSNRSGLICEPDPEANYSRVGVDNDVTHWPSALLNAGWKTNDVNILWPQPSGGWGRLRSLFIADGPDRGALVWYMADFRIPFIADAERRPWLPAGTLRLSWLPG